MSKSMIFVTAICLCNLALALWSANEARKAAGRPAVTFTPPAVNVQVTQTNVEVRVVQTNVELGKKEGKDGMKNSCGWMQGQRFS